VAFTDFKSADQVQKSYKICYIEKDFLTLVARDLPDYFVRELEFDRENFDVFGSEASRCESIIYPILREACKGFIRDYSLWSHKSIAVDDILTGTPDYIIAKRSELGKNVLDFPLVLVAEAKQNDFARGWGQCLAEMVAAQRLNGTTELAVYGIVTDGEIWQFGRLVGSVFTRNLSRVTIDRVEEVYGAVFGLIELSVQPNN
jgi:hypothetical protein